LAWNCRILGDSLAPSGARLTTMELTFPRFVLSEWNTHREMSRNAASSRAIPVQKMLERVQQDPAIPCFWGAAQKGMQADHEVADTARAKELWLAARDEAVRSAERLLEIGLHKQLANRVLAPFYWVTVVASATNWANFFWLRCSRDAQPEIRKIAAMALVAYRCNQPTPLAEGEWHTPLIFPEDEGLDEETRIKVSVARCARVSYLTHDGRRDIQADLDLYERLKTSGHWSPFEHVARAASEPVRSGNFWGWEQWRKLQSGEHRSTMTPEQMDDLIREMKALGVLDS
jgi:thymidylate synthase ThyX